MSTLDWLSEDFNNIALDDKGVSATVTHLNTQVFDPDTGDYTNTETIDTIEGILGRVTKQDLDAHPDTVKVTDQVFRCDQDALTYIPAKGTKIVIGSNNYIVIWHDEIDDVLRIIIRRH